MKLIAILGVFLALAACEPVEDEPEFGLAGYDPHQLENQQAACKAQGGRFATGGISGVLVCYLDTGEIGKSCSTSNDCKGLCLARSRTCAPVTPMFGCHEVLGSLGAQSTLCVE